jgi:hypothetical protein
MKRIFTLLFALGTIAAVQAQPGNRNNRDFNDGKDNVKVIITDNDDFDKGFRTDDRISPNRKLAMEVAKVNREYDYKIQAVRNSFFMNRFAKQRKIQQLEEQRQWEIKMLYKKYSKYNRRGFDDHGRF